MHGYRAISTHLAQWPGSIGGFVRDLDRQGAPYLSFSQVACLDFCDYRYFLEYVRGLRLRPEPAYFVKGRIFHEAAARIYRSLARQRPIKLDALHGLVDRRCQHEPHHVKNAVQLATDNAFRDWQVVAIEHPFVLSLGTGLPPCLGVIDLILRRGKQFAVVDHKTGKNFNDLEDWQLVLYREYVRRRFRPRECLTFFDEYRWVNNLERIRKPAFQRTQVRPRQDAWDRVLKRMTQSHKRMRRIEREQDAPAHGPCYQCPFQNQCPRATLSFGGWW